MNATIKALPISDIPDGANIIVIVLTGWVAKSHYIAGKGMTDGQIRGKIQRKEWKKGVHYIIDGRDTWLNVEAIDQWRLAENTPEGCDQVHEEASRYAGSSRVKAIQSTSTSHRHQHI